MPGSLTSDTASRYWPDEVIQTQHGHQVQAQLEGARYPAAYL
jgi:hypothetical protein